MCFSGLVELPFQTFIYRPAMKTFNIVVLPWTVGITIDCLDTIFFKPLPEVVSDKLIAVIAADIGGDAILGYSLSSVAKT